MSIGTRLRLLLEQSGLSQTDLARRLDISVSTLNGYITDYREPDAKMLLRLAEELQTTTDYLISGQGGEAAGYRNKVKVIAHNEGVSLTREQEDEVAHYMQYLLEKSKDDG